MTTLAQILGIEKGVRNQTREDLTKMHRDVQVPQLLFGVARTYQPLDDAGERFPDETTRVQLRVDDVLAQIAKHTTRVIDVVATKDNANTRANADVVIDGNVLLKAVPATHLLFLEKEFQDLHTEIKKLPVLPQNEKWDFDPDVGVQATEPVKTAKSKKNPKVLVKYEATEKHPAQTEVWYEDEVVGYWTTIKFSGALPMERKVEILERTRKLLDAVRMAREAANKIEVEDVKEGERIFGYLFA